MPRYIALLRGVTPLNAKSADLKRAFESAGFTAVKTILASGNVAFGTRAASEAALIKRCEGALLATLGRSFYTIVRSSAALNELLTQDPYAAHQVPAEAKRVVSFFREACVPRVPLPISADGAQLLAIHGREAFTAYVASDKGPVFMELIQRAFGKDVTTRTWDTVRKCAAA